MHLNRHRHLSTFNALLTFFGKPLLVEFDYRDVSGVHHGQSYIHGYFVGEHRIRAALKQFGYTNITFWA